MSSLFCCGSIEPYRPQRLSHEAKFVAFMAWAEYPRSAVRTEDGGQHGVVSSGSYTPPFVIQLVQQVNYGALESKRYFAPVEGNNAEFIETTEEALIQANFQKLNTYKNYKCSVHNKFFEINVYQKDPSNAHHWRVNLARPASNIDI